MKTFAKFLLLLSPLLLSGCFDILEELWLNKDQSGRYELTVTMGSGPMANMIQAVQKRTNDSLMALGLPPRPMDTTIYLRNLPDSIQKMLPYQDVVQTLEIYMKMEKGIKFRFKYPFNHLDSLHRFWQTLTALDEIQKDSVIKKSKVLDFPVIGNIQQMLGGTPVMHWKGKTFQRTIESEENDGSEMMGELFENSDNPMVKMMVRNRTYELKFHLPKKVKRVSTDGYVKEGNEVRAKFPLTQVIKDRSQLECTIKMK